MKALLENSIDYINTKLPTGLWIWESSEVRVFRVTECSVFTVCSATQGEVIFPSHLRDLRKAGLESARRSH
jgi:hypothetical protein